MNKIILLFFLSNSCFSADDFIKKVIKSQKEEWICRKADNKNCVKYLDVENVKAVEVLVYENSTVVVSTYDAKGEITPLNKSYVVKVLGSLDLQRVDVKIEKREITLTD